MAKNHNLGNFLTISRSNISKSQIFLKNKFHTNWSSYFVLTSGQKPKKSFQPFLRKMCLNMCQSVSFWANLENFSQISPNQEFFFKSPALSLLYLYSLLTSCKKPEKFLEPFLTKLCYQPTKQPIITNNTDLTGPHWRQSNQKLKHILAWKLLIKTCLDVFYENGLLLL